MSRSAQIIVGLWYRPTFSSSIDSVNVPLIEPATRPMLRMKSCSGSVHGSPPAASSGSSSTSVIVIVYGPDAAALYHPEALGPVNHPSTVPEPVAYPGDGYPSKPGSPKRDAANVRECGVDGGVLGPGLADKPALGATPNDDSGDGLGAQAAMTAATPQQTTT